MKSLLLLPAFLVAASLPFDRAVPEVSRPLADHEWAVDSGHSACMFRIKHANVSWFLGMIDRVEGKLTLDPAAPEKGSVMLNMPVKSIDTNDKNRDGHLLGPDFFASKENPDITFKSTKIKKDGDKNLVVTGDLSMAGKTNSITFPVEFSGEGDFRGPRRGYIANFTVKRSDFGMTYGVKGNMLGDDVHMTVSLELIQPK